MITLRFVTCNDPISAAIRAAEYGFWASHVEALMPDNTLLGAHAVGGVQARPRDYDAGKFTRELYVEIPTEPAVASRFHDFLERQIGKPYDIEAIAGFLIRRNWRDDDAWFCSELQSAALEFCGWFDLASGVSHITPRDLLLVVSGRVSIAKTVDD